MLVEADERDGVDCGGRRAARAPVHECHFAEDRSGLERLELALAVMDSNPARVYDVEAIGRIAFPKDVGARREL